MRNKVLNIVSSHKQVKAEVEPKTLDITTASKFIQKWISESNSPEHIEKYQLALSGDKVGLQQYEELVLKMLKEELVTIDDYSTEEAASEIASRHCGLEELGPFAVDKTVDEIRVAPGGRLWITQRGIHKKTDIIIQKDKIMTLIERLIPYNDTGVSLNESNPMMELVRPDGCRLTALCYPVTPTHCFALRKLGNVEATPENFIRLQTMDRRLWEIVSLMAKGRRNILVCGGVNSAKSTFMKMLVGELDSRLSIRVLDIDNEMRLSEMYPDREIWDMEAHPEVKADLKSIFTTILRLSPDVIIVPEFRGKGETWITIEACTRGHDGSMASAHFTSHASAEEVIRNVAMLSVQEGVNMPLDKITERVSQAFQIIIQTFSDSTKGVKKITAVTEIIRGEAGKEFKVNPLVKWVPYTEDFVGQGEWKVLNKPSDACCEAMRIYGVSMDEINKAFGKDE